MEMTKEILIDAIMGGCYIPYGGISEDLTPFDGNQWNEDWCWSKSELEKMTYADLNDLYRDHKWKK